MVNIQTNTATANTFCILISHLINTKTGVDNWRFQRKHRHMSMKFTGWQCSASSTKWSLDAFIGVWSYDDNGDVPAKYEIPIGQITKMKKPFGVVLDPKHKEL